MVSNEEEEYQSCKAMWHDQPTIWWLLMMRAYPGTKLHTASALHCHLYNGLYLKEIKKEEKAPDYKSNGNFITSLYVMACDVFTAGSSHIRYQYERVQ